VSLTADKGTTLAHLLAAAFFAVSFVFVYRSFYSMRIRTGSDANAIRRERAAAD